MSEQLIAVGLNGVDAAEVSRLIGDRGGATVDATSSMHAYQVALKSLRERCRKQAEQLRRADEDGRRLIADKAALHAEIEQLRDAAGRHRERGSQLHRELADQHRQGSALREQLCVLRRRLAEAGLSADVDSSEQLSAGSSLEQTDRETAELHVPVPAMKPAVGQLQLPAELLQLAEAIQQRNTALRQCIQQLEAARPPEQLQEVPLSDGEQQSTCPLCEAVFQHPRDTHTQYEDHVYGHLQQMMLTPRPTP